MAPLVQIYSTKKPHSGWGAENNEFQECEFLMKVILVSMEIPESTSWKLKNGTTKLDLRQYSSEING